MYYYIDMLWRSCYVMCKISNDIVNDSHREIYSEPD